LTSELQKEHWEQSLSVHDDRPEELQEEVLLVEESFL
jgi:hypothetical protein